MTITMYDSATNSQFPPGAAAYAAYVDGGIGDQPNYAYIVKAFPNAHHLSIALFAGHDADALDVEPYAATPQEIPTWHARQVARGIVRPVVYASVAAMREAVLPVLATAGIGAGQRRLWTAHYGEGEHLCGPKSCGQLPFDADGTQWTSTAPGAAGGVVDVSILRDDFFGTVSNVTDIPLDIRGSYTDGAGNLYVIGVNAQGVLCEVKRHAPGQWGEAYPIAGKAGA